MRPNDWRKWALSALVGLVLAACGGATASVSSSPGTPGSSATSAPDLSSTAPSPSPSPSLSPSLSPVATKGPPSARLSITGTAGLTGPVSATTIKCNQPSLDGPEISFLGQSGSSGPQIVVFARAGHVEVRVGTGAAATLRLRTFVGSGVTKFDAATGLTLDSPLSETTPAATATGTLGALSAISGTIDCGNEQPGVANIVVTGPTPYGPVDGALTGVAVTCTITASGTFVGIVGLSRAGTTPVLVFVTAGTDSLQVAVETSATGAFYTAKGAALTSISPSGATIGGDANQSVPSGSTASPSAIHVTGTATCGTTIRQ